MVLKIIVSEDSDISASTLLALNLLSEKYPRLSIYVGAAPSSALPGLLPVSYYSGRAKSVFEYGKDGMDRLISLLLFGA